MPQVTALRRYPVKSMGGESLDSLALDSRGVLGDRLYAVVDAEGRLASGKDTRRFRRRDAVFGYAAATGPDRVVVRRNGDRWRVGSEALDAELSASFGAPVRVLAEAATPHLDAGPVSLVGTATLAWVAQNFGGSPDPRRIRANVLLQTDQPFEEERWVGQLLSVGTAFLGVRERAERCRMIDLAQDGVPAERWLKPLAAERDMCLGIYADVQPAGTVSVGDEVAPA